MAVNRPYPSPPVVTRPVPPPTVVAPPLPRPLAAGRWRVDASASCAEFCVGQAWGLSTVDGHFTRFGGELELDATGSGRAELRIDAASVETGHRRRDRHLRGARYFDCDRHPVVRYVAAAVPAPGGGLELTGELEAAGEAIVLDLSADVEGGDDRLELRGGAQIDARTLGMSWSPVGRLRTPVALTVRAVLQPVT